MRRSKYLSSPQILIEHLVCETLLLLLVMKSVTGDKKWWRPSTPGALRLSSCCVHSRALSVCLPGCVPSDCVGSCLFSFVVLHFFLPKFVPCICIWCFFIPFLYIFLMSLNFMDFFVCFVSWLLEYEIHFLKILWQETSEGPVVHK